MQIHRTLIAVCLLLAGSPARSATWHVATNGVDNADPGRGESWDLPYATISNAIAKAADNEEILVSNGLYQIKVISIAKPLRVIGVDGPENTTLDAGGATRVIDISANGVLLAGFTLTNGYLNTSGHYGAGLRMTGGCTVSNCIIAGNNNAFRQGGGLYCAAPLDTTGIIVKCSIIGNQATSGGGAVLTNNVIMSDCLIAENQNTSSHGGGIFMRQGPAGNISVRNCTIVSNIALSQGGGVYIVGGGLVENCEFYGNQSLADTNKEIYIGGGGIYVQIGEIRNCLFTRNTAANNGGGILLHGAAKVYNCTFTANTAGRWGGGFYQQASSPDTVENTILWYNTATEGGDNWFCYYREITSVLTNNCLGWGAVSASIIPYAEPPLSYGGGFNITNEPALVNPTGGSDCRLRYGSPCINTALHYAWMDDAVDLDGNPRLDSAWHLPDIGCYEFMLNRGTIFSVR